MDGILIFSYRKSNAHSLTSTPHFKKSYVVRTYSEPIDPVLVFVVYLLLILCGIWGFFMNIIIQSQISQLVSKNNVNAHFRCWLSVHHAVCVRPDNGIHGHV